MLCTVIFFSLTLQSSAAALPHNHARRKTTRLWRMTLTTRCPCRITCSTTKTRKWRWKDGALVNLVMIPVTLCYSVPSEWMIDLNRPLPKIPAQRFVVRPAPLPPPPQHCECEDGSPHPLYREAWHGVSQYAFTLMQSSRIAGLPLLDAGGAVSLHARLPRVESLVDRPAPLAIFVGEAWKTQPIFTEGRGSTAAAHAWHQLDQPEQGSGDIDVTLLIGNCHDVGGVADSAIATAALFVIGWFVMGSNQCIMFIQLSVGGHSGHQLVFRRVR